LVDRKIVGSPLNFRGLVYSPINEQGVVYLFGLIANDLNIRVESVQQGYPDCTAIRYVGKGKWERIDIEFEYRSSNFDHDPDKCDILVCWEDDLQGEKRNVIKGLEIIELKSIIDTDEVPNIVPKDPEEVSKELQKFDLEYHFKRKKVTKKTQELYLELDNAIQSIDESIWLKYAQTSITYYSPEKVFVYLKFRRNFLSLKIYTDQRIIEGVQNIKDHEHWGNMQIKSEAQLPMSISAIKLSFELMKKAIEENKNTGWYALTPRNKRTEKEDDE